MLDTLLTEPAAVPVPVVSPAAGPTPVWVTRADGSRIDLAPLSADALRALQWDEERAFARQIAQAEKGSAARAEAMRVGYDTVCTIFARRTAQGGSDFVMGYSPRYEDLVVRLLRQARPATGPARLFEVGFGSGQFLRRIHTRGYDVAGFEVSTAMAALARAQLPAEVGERLYVGEFLSHELGGPAATYDVVYWNDVFEHIPTDEILEYLWKLHRLLRPGGVLVTITPNWHLRPSDITAEYEPPRTEAAGFHLREYTLREVTALLRAAGFARVATPLCATRRRFLLAGSGLAGVKRCVEPALEWLPWSLTRLLVRGGAFYCTLAHKAR